MKKRYCGCFLIALIFLPSCGQQPSNRAVEIAFYHWKTNVNPTAFEIRKADSLDAKKVYIKFFDVVWNEARQQPTPVAKALINNTPWMRSKKIIPTVFITNECIAKLNDNTLQQLADNISQLVNNTLSANHIGPISEIQIDCDWTATTKQNYFALLTKIKQQNKDVRLSATIRLHQIKFKSSTGIPPVDKGLLMCYNMGNLQDESTTNSIIDPNTLSQYINKLSTYPLSLDVGLPLFSWYVLFRNHQYAGLLQDVSLDQFPTTMIIKKNNSYHLLKDTVIGNRFLRKDDILRYEKTTAKDLYKVASLINKKISSKQLSLVYYHLDSILLNKFSTYELQNIADRLR